MIIFFPISLIILDNNCSKLVLITQRILYNSAQSSIIIYKKMQRNLSKLFSLQIITLRCTKLLLTTTKKMFKDDSKKNY